MVKHLFLSGETAIPLPPSLIECYFIFWHLFPPLLLVMAQVLGQLGYEANRKIYGALKAELTFWQVIFKPRHYFSALVHNVMVQGQEPAVGKQEYVMFSLLPRTLSHEGQVTKMFIFLLHVSLQSGTSAARKTSSSLLQSISVWWLSPSFQEWKWCGFKLLYWRLMPRLCREDALAAREAGQLAAPAVTLRCIQAFLPVPFTRWAYK